MKTRFRAPRLLAAVVIGLGLCRKGEAQTTTIPDALRDVAYYNAPYIAAEVHTRTTLDAYAYSAIGTEQLVSIDLDHNLDGSDNYTHAMTNPFGMNPTATVYYSAHETGYASDKGYYILSYYFYHVLDMGFSAAIGYDAGHEHDLEGVTLIFKKTPYMPYGSLSAALTQAHGALLPWIPTTTLGEDNTPAGAAVGYVEKWNDSRYNYQWSRAVVALAAGDHAAYMAQNCNPNYPYSGGGADNGYGVYLGTEQQGYTMCIHTPRSWMRYMPQQPEAFYYPGSYDNPDTPDPYWVGPGPITYGLVEVRQSPFWSQATAPNGLFSGALLSNPDRFQGLTYFRASSSDVGGGTGANPMWQWEGGPGVCFANHCYYTFGEDGTNTYHVHGLYPTSPNYGQLLTRPVSEVALRFPNLPELDQPYRYNPYLNNPPDYNTPPSTLSVGISGPSNVQSGALNTWRATISGGTPPYTLTWSGIATGGGTSISKRIYSSDYLNLSVIDAAGTRLNTSLYVTVACVSGQTQCTQ